MMFVHQTINGLLTLLTYLLIYTTIDFRTRVTCFKLGTQAIPKSSPLFLPRDAL